MGFGVLGLSSPENKCCPQRGYQRAGLSLSLSLSLPDALGLRDAGACMKWMGSLFTLDPAGPVNPFCFLCGGVQSGNMGGAARKVSWRRQTKDMTRICPDLRIWWCVAPWFWGLVGVPCPWTSLSARASEWEAAFEVACTINAAKQEHDIEWHAISGLRAESAMRW